MRLTQCPMPRAGGADCWRDPHPASPYNLCVEHWRKTVEQWFEDQPAINFHCYWCGTLNVVDSVDLGHVRCQHCTAKLEVDADMLEALRVETQDQRMGRAIQGVVYYMRFSDRVKIGFTSNLRVRAKSVPNDEVLAAHPGTYDTERMMHIRFSKDRITDRGEWFHVSPPLLDHIAAVRTKYGDPFMVKVGTGEEFEA